MEATLIRIGPQRKKRQTMGSRLAPEQRAISIDERTFEFFCLWSGDTELLQELISGRVDWGPFEVRCEPAEAPISDHCRCEVRYNGPYREKQNLMASFWGLMEDFPPFELSSYSRAPSPEQQS